MTEAFKKTIAIDFDGVLHTYSKGWQGGDIYDPPMPGAVKACEMLAVNFNLIVFTTRSEANRVRSWLHTYKFPVMEVTNYKPLAVIYIDDRAYRFTSWAQTLLDLEANIK